jgi:TolB-like protein/DNA-binding winged helix-turn-helix (wHTH) protein/cytochrome c-type biogenesis protein CcmH/NrfG
LPSRKCQFNIYGVCLSLFGVKLDDMYSFGEFTLDPRRRILARGDSPISLTPKAFDVLSFLLQNPNRLVSKEELLRAVWGDTFVEDGILTQYVSHLRKALGENSENARLIVTIARKGYQFAGEVVVYQGDLATQGQGQLSDAETWGADVAPTPEIPRIEGAPSKSKSWRKGVIAASLIVLLAGVGYLSWRCYRSRALAKTRRVMLAVLPFQNLTGDPGKEYLADGLTEETISQLGRLNPEQLGVIARTSVMGYKHTNERLDQIGRDLSVQYVLENSLRENGDHIRLTAQLVQVKDQTHLWSQDYDYPVKDVLNVEDEVAKAVAHEIRVRLTSQQQAELAQSHTVNPEAFDAYMQGYYFFQRNTSKDAEMAAKYYERATQLDPSYAPAWVGLSRVRNWEVNIDLIPAEKGHRLAREAVERALALNPNLAEAHAQMGRIKEQADFDWAGADASFRRANALEPGNPEFVRLAGVSAAYAGRLDEALQLDRRAVDLDPLNAYSWDFLAETRFFRGQLDEAATDSKKALALSPDVWPGPILLSRIYLMQGRPHDALAEIKLVRFDAARVQLYAIAYHMLGRGKESDTALSELIEKYQDPTFVAEVYACRNQSDKAFEWLDRAYAKHDGGLIHLRIEPLLKNLHSDPRFAALLKKLNMPE